MFDARSLFCLDTRTTISRDTFIGIKCYFSMYVWRLYVPAQHAHTHKRTQAQAHTHTRTHTKTPTHTHTHTRTHIQWKRGHGCDEIRRGTTLFTKCSEEDDPRMGGQWRKAPRWAVGGTGPSRPWMLTESYSLNINWMFPKCSPNVHWMFTECSLNVHRMFTECSLNVHQIRS
jgi:hypothetical protein